MVAAGIFFSWSIFWRIIFRIWYHCTFWNHCTLRFPIIITFNLINPHIFFCFRANNLLKLILLIFNQIYLNNLNISSILFIIIIKLFLVVHIIYFTFSHLIMILINLFIFIKIRIIFLNLKVLWWWCGWERLGKMYLNAETFINWRRDIL
jgi:hypothetical protein